MQNMDKQVLSVFPRGFCLGVARAIKMLDKAIEQEEERIYVRQEIVHNTVLVEHYKSLGVIFVNEVDEVPNGGLVVFSAHGVAPSVWEKARARNLRVIDTTCPLVTKVHKEAIRLKEQGYSIILIGEIGHKEVIGITGEAPDNIQVIQNEADVDNVTDVDSSHIAWLSQTTLNVDDTQCIVDRLHKKFPRIQAPPKSDICYATRDRQLAVKNTAKGCDLFVVVGSATSSNTRRLAEVALAAGAKSVIRVDEPEELNGLNFSFITTIGVTAGVSVTEGQLNKVTAHLEEMGYVLKEDKDTFFENDSSIEDDLFT